MPTVVTHAILPLAVAVSAGPKQVPVKIAMTGAFLAMLPDIDVVGFRFGVSYDSVWGHRGAMHSLAIGATLVLVLATIFPVLRKGWSIPFLLFAIASHGLCDTLTDGGRGVALFWPFDVTRYFAPWRPIRVSPIGVRFFSSRGLVTVISEMRWIWLPCLLVAVSALIFRRGRRGAKEPISGVFGVSKV